MNMAELKYPARHKCPGTVKAGRCRIADRLYKVYALAAAATIDERAKIADARRAREAAADAASVSTTDTRPEHASPGDACMNMTSGVNPEATLQEPTPETP